MAYVGNLGGIPFITSSLFIRTFSDLERGGDGRWLDHEIIGQKPVTEFIGPNTESISMELHFSARYGVNPEHEAEKLRVLRNKGKVFPLFIGGRPVNNCFWYIAALSEKVDYHDGWGQPIAMTIRLSLKEYSGNGGLLTS